MPSTGTSCQLAVHWTLTPLSSGHISNPASRTARRPSGNCRHQQVLGISSPGWSRSLAVSACPNRPGRGHDSRLTWAMRLLWEASRGAADRVLHRHGWAIRWPACSNSWDVSQLSEKQWMHHHLRAYEPEGLRHCRRSRIGRRPGGRPVRSSTGYWRTELWRFVVCPATRLAASGSIMSCCSPRNVIVAKVERVPFAAHCESLPIGREYRFVDRPNSVRRDLT